MDVHSELVLKSRKTLEANLVPTVEGEMLAAGGGQFKSLWVRDFCFSVPGLLKSGYRDLIKRQLNAILARRSGEGFLPRGLDVVDPKVRVVWNLLLNRPPPRSDYRDRKLNPEFLGEHGTPAYDSNLLFVLAAREAGLFTVPELVELLDVYPRHGLLRQPPYSDWQDSVRREGAILHSQLLFLLCLLALGQHKAAEALRSSVERHFFRDGFFREGLEGSQISLDSQALILTRAELFPALDRSAYYLALKAHPLWARLPGRPVYPNHPRDQISWTTKAVGLRHYHDEFLWGWLSAEAVRCARAMGDEIEANRITLEFHRLTEMDPYLAEIYENKGRVRRLFYRAEMPFSWTAAKWLEALL